MSVQTLSDIIVNQQVKPSELQLSGQTQISPKKSESSVNFADLVSFYKDESKSEPVDKQEYKEPVADSSQKSNVKEEKSDVSTETDSKVVVKDEKTEKTEDVKNTKSGKKSEKVEKQDETAKSEKKTELKSKKSDEKEAKSEKSEKKVEKFSRLDEIVNLEKNVVVENNDVAKKLINNQEELEVKSDFKIEVKDNAEVNNPYIQVAENLGQSEANENLNPDFNDKDFTKDFNFGEKKSEKTAALDKDGKITVEDLRSKDVAEVEKTEKNVPKLKTELKINNENTATITMEYANSVEADVLSLNNQTAGSNGSTYQQMLNNQVQMNVPEFVKAGNIVLKDNNQGSINLVLHPDDLGNVKIRLTLDGKTVTGHITVASKEALEVFKDNAETLREAFIKSGFDAANFDVAYGGNNSNFGENAEFQRNDGTELFGRKMYDSVASGNDDYLDSGDYSEILVNSENFSVNIVA